MWFYEKTGILQIENVEIDWNSIICIGYEHFNIFSLKFILHGKLSINQFPAYS
jgi:hypothetical protein